VPAGGGRRAAIARWRGARWIASTTTTASSMTRPTAMARAAERHQVEAKPARDVDDGAPLAASGRRNRQRPPPAWAARRAQRRSSSRSPTKSAPRRIASRHRPPFARADERRLLVHRREDDAGGPLPSAAWRARPRKPGVERDDVAADAARDVDHRRGAARGRAAPGGAGSAWPSEIVRHVGEPHRRALAAGRR